MQILGIQNQAEKQSLTDNAENVIQAAAPPENMMQTNLNNRIKAVVPKDPFRIDLIFFMVICQTYRNGGVNFCNHIR